MKATRVNLRAISRLLAVVLSASPLLDRLNIKFGHEHLFVLVFDVAVTLRGAQRDHCRNFPRRWLRLRDEDLCWRCGHHLILV